METEQLETQQNTAIESLQPAIETHEASHLKPWQFNASNASEMARKSWELKRQRAEAAKLAPKLQTHDTQLSPLQRVIMGQIETIDDLMTDCKPREMVAYADAKAKLWKLLFPTPKGGKPRHDRSDFGQA